MFDLGRVRNQPGIVSESATFRTHFRHFFDLFHEKSIIYPFSAIFVILRVIGSEGSKNLMGLGWSHMSKNGKNHCF